MSGSSAVDKVKNINASGGWHRFKTYFGHVKLGALLIATIAGAISKVAIRHQLVPEQLDWLADAGVLVAMASLAILPLYSPTPRAQKLLILTLISCIGVVLLVRV